MGYTNPFSPTKKIYRPPPRGGGGGGGSPTPDADQRPTGRSWRLSRRPPSAVERNGAPPIALDEPRSRPSGERIEREAPTCHVGIWDRCTNQVPSTLCGTPNTLCSTPSTLWGTSSTLCGTTRTLCSTPNTLCVFMTALTVFAGPWGWELWRHTVSSQKLFR